MQPHIFWLGLLIFSVRASGANEIDCDRFASVRLPEFKKVISDLNSCRSQLRKAMGVEDLLGAKVVSFKGKELLSRGYPTDWGDETQILFDSNFGFYRAMRIGRARVNHGPLAYECWKPSNRIGAFFLWGDSGTDCCRRQAVATCEGCSDKNECSEARIEELKTFTSRGQCKGFVASFGNLPSEIHRDLFVLYQRQFFRQENKESIKHILMKCQTISKVYSEFNAQSPDRLWAGDQLDDDHLNNKNLQRLNDSPIYRNLRAIVDGRPLEAIAIESRTPQIRGDSLSIPPATR